MVFDASQRLITVSGTLHDCCAEKMARVLEFSSLIAPGDMSIDLAGVMLLDPSVAAAIQAGSSQLIARELRLDIIGGSPAVIHNLNS